MDENHEEGLRMKRYRKKEVMFIGSMNSGRWSVVWELNDFQIDIAKLLSYLA